MATRLARESNGTLLRDDSDAQTATGSSVIGSDSDASALTQVKSYTP